MRNDAHPIDIALKGLGDLIITSIVIGILGGIYEVSTRWIIPHVSAHSMVYTKLAIALIALIVGSYLIGYVHHNHEELREQWL